MSTEVIDSDQVSPSGREVLFFVPDLRGFLVQIRRWYNRWVMVNSQNVWAAILPYDEIEEYAMAMMRAYFHITYNDVYVRYGSVSASVGKLNKSVGALCVPRYWRDMFRELARNMQIGNMLFVPYLPLLATGNSIVPGLGIFAIKHQDVSLILQAVKEFDCVYLENESPRREDLFIATDHYVTFLTTKVPKYRFDAVTILRHLQPSCEFFEMFQAINNTVGGDDGKPKRLFAMKDNIDAQVPDCMALPDPPVVAGEDKYRYVLSVNKHEAYRVVQNHNRDDDIAFGRDPRSDNADYWDTVVGGYTPERIHKWALIASTTEREQERSMTGRYLYPALQNVYTVPVNIRFVGVEIQPRFPTVDERSSTPPNSAASTAAKIAKQPKQTKQGKKVAAKAELVLAVPERGSGS